MKLLSAFVILCLLFAAVSSKADAQSSLLNPTLYYSYDTACQFGTHKAVTFDQDACASWNPGTSQMNTCVNANPVNEFCFQIIIYNGTANNCARENELAAEPVPCNACLPEKSNPGKFFVVSGCGEEQMKLSHGCIQGCGVCAGTQDLNEKSCQLLNQEMPVLVYIDQIKQCGPRAVMISHWNSNEKCQGVPDKTETLYNGFCYSAMGTGTGTSFACEPTIAKKTDQDVEKKPPRLFRSLSNDQQKKISSQGLQQGNTEVWQCPTPFCNATDGTSVTDCHRVATYYKDACIAYGAQANAQRFDCLPLNSSGLPEPQMCLNIVQYQKESSTHPTCSNISNIFNAFTQLCDKCYPDGSTPGKYYMYDKCSGSSSIHLLYGCTDPACQSAGCQGSVDIPVESCQAGTTGTNTANLYRTPQPCDAELDLTVWTSSRRCGGAANQNIFIPAWKNTCSTSGKGGDIGQQFRCV